MPRYFYRYCFEANGDTFARSQRNDDEFRDGT